MQERKAVLKRGLFIGRFEPFHKGHESAILTALERVHHLVIVIGSAQNTLSDRNCFTLEERKAMVEGTLQAHKISNDRYTLSAVPDFFENEAWRDAILRAGGRIDIIFSGNEIVEGIFRSLGYHVEDCEKQRTYPIHGTLIRAKIHANDGSWKQDVPACVVGIVEKANIKKRLKELKQK